MRQSALFGIGSVTQAMQAKKLLNKNGIGAEILKLKPGQSQYGCGYGVVVDVTEQYRVASLLDKSHIRHNLL